MGVKTRIVTDSITLHDVDVINACIAALQDLVLPEPTIGGAELAGMPMGSVTIGSANIFVGIPPTSEDFFKILVCRLYLLIVAKLLRAKSVF